MATWIIAKFLSWIKKCVDLSPNLFSGAPLAQRAVFSCWPADGQNVKDNCYDLLLICLFSHLQYTVECQRCYSLYISALVVVLAWHRVCRQIELQSPNLESKTTIEMYITPHPGKTDFYCKIMLRPTNRD